MIVSGLQKFSLLDYPGRLSAIIFTQGCNFRCHFCYNPLLVVRPEDREDKFTDTASSSLDEETKKGHPAVLLGDLFDFLASRKNKLDAVVISGGEPTIHNDLPEFIKKIKELGFKIKLDTNGTNPIMLKRLFKEQLLDYVAMDIKGPARKYDLITGVQANLKSIKESITMIMNSGVAYELRTTVVPDFLDENDIKAMGEMIKGAEKWFLQVFKSDIDLVNPDFRKTKSYTAKQMDKLKNIAQDYVKNCAIR